MIFDRMQKKGKDSVTIPSGGKHEIEVKFSPKQIGVVTQVWVFSSLIYM